MINFLDETIEMIYSNEQCIDNILFIGKIDDNLNCDWKHFKKISDFDYDPSYGSNEIDLDLEIIFKDGSRAFRMEYDGSEWWSYKGVFRLPTETLRLDTVKGC